MTCPFARTWGRERRGPPTQMRNDFPVPTPAGGCRALKERRSNSHQSGRKTCLITHPQRGCEPSSETGRTDNGLVGPGWTTLVMAQVVIGGTPRAAGRICTHPPGLPPVGSPAWATPPSIGGTAICWRTAGWSSRMTTTPPPPLRSSPRGPHFVGFPARSDWSPGSQSPARTDQRVPRRFKHIHHRQRHSDQRHPRLERCLIVLT